MKAVSQTLVGWLPPVAQRWLPRQLRQPPAIPNALWHTVLSQHPFLGALDEHGQALLKQLSAHFLAEKEFHGAHGLVVSDAMALAIAAQACLPLLQMAAPDGQRHPRLKTLDWYDDFVGIVVHPSAAWATREVTDDTGVVHRYRELLAGEAMDGGPLMLSWDEVARAPLAAAQGHNVVIHEFIHKMDMRGRGSAPGHPDGAPALPPGFLGWARPEQAREHWRATMQVAYDRFREAVVMAERFGGEKPWLDDYAAESPAEFFAVTSEAYFVNRGQFGQSFPDLVPLYDGFYRPA